MVSFMRFRRAFASVVYAVVFCAVAPAFAAPTKKDAPASVAKAEVPLAGHLAESEALFDRALGIAKKNGLTGDEEISPVFTGIAEIQDQPLDWVIARGENPQRQYTAYILKAQGEPIAIELGAVLHTEKKANKSVLIMVRRRRGA